MGIPGRDTPEAMAGFVNQYELEHIPHAQDLDGRLWERFGVFGQPAWYFINDDGTSQRKVGSLSESEVRAILQEMESR